ncbi:Uncharacterised protein [Mycobacteroides abscessus subsp. abscessus]|nr:Uncharacterised protein [Mycobacteroides abscessus subsp. abscessus]
MPSAHPVRASSAAAAPASPPSSLALAIACPSVSCTWVRAAKTAEASAPNSASPKAVPSSKLISEIPVACPARSVGAAPRATADTKVNMTPAPAPTITVAAI